MNRRTERILVVDDEPDIVRIVRYLLGAEGYEVIPGYGGEDALRKARAKKVDLILTDLAMPRMSGVELIEEIRKDPVLCDTPIICLTAFVWDTLGRSAGDLGCNAFVAKPVEPKNLLSTVERCLMAA